MKWLAISIFLITSTLAEENPIDFNKANNLFATTTYKEVLRSNQANFLVSPFSVETVLAFAQSGCKGETGKELRQALHLPEDEDKIQNDIKTLLAQIKDNENYALHTANKMYVQKNFELKEDFKSAARQVYRAESENIDFTKNQEAANTMNQWVEEETNNKIHNLVDPAILTNDSRVLLLNALYLKADWKTPFQLSNTNKDKFYKSANDLVEVDTLHLYPVRKLENTIKYYECHHLRAKFLELPFKGEEASMTIILPNEKEGLSALEDQIDKAFMPHDLTSKFVYISLPKFKIESEIDFKEILANLGVSKAFSEEFADLSGIAGEPGDLIIDKVVQKTFIDVSENGVEAAAATHVAIIRPMSGFASAEYFIADHPFLFYIKIKNLIVFAGRVTDPSK